MTWEDFDKFFIELPPCCFGRVPVVWVPKLEPESSTPLPAIRWGPTVFRYIIPEAYMEALLEEPDPDHVVENP